MLRGSYKTHKYNAGDTYNKASVPWNVNEDVSNVKNVRLVHCAR
jgi:hypothetical protein